MVIYKRFEDLPVWKTSRKLTKQVYLLSKQGDFQRDFGLRDQIRRSAVSVMSNIAEGFDSETQALLISYLSRARASASEVRSQLYIAFDLGYLSKDEFEETKRMAVQCSRQLFGFISYLRNQPNARRISDKESPRYVIDFP